MGKRFKPKWGWRNGGCFSCNPEEDERCTEILQELGIRKPRRYFYARLDGRPRISDRKKSHSRGERRRDRIVLRRRGERHGRFGEHLQIISRLHELSMSYFGEHLQIISRLRELNMSYLTTKGLDERPRHTEIRMALSHVTEKAAELADCLSRLDDMTLNKLCDTHIRIQSDAAEASAEELEAKREERAPMSSERIAEIVRNLPEGFGSIIDRCGKDASLIARVAQQSAAGMGKAPMGHPTEYAVLQGHIAALADFFMQITGERPTMGRKGRFYSFVAAWLKLVDPVLYGRLADGALADGAGVYRALEWHVIEVLKRTRGRLPS